MEKFKAPKKKKKFEKKKLELEKDKFKLTPEKYPPFEKSILEYLENTRIGLTHTQIARLTHMHPATSKVKIQKLEEDGLISSEKIGKRIYYRKKVE
ncbi:helix-turn-helix transcriptional regulator [Candidatus Woesearchaeota archaeon]|nr:helix-turn-helix transcriptional regulator [Candidatus Woesearchaeota archaeon]